MKIIAMIYGISLLYFLLFGRDELEIIDKTIREREQPLICSIMVYIAAFAFMPPFALVNAYYDIKAVVIWLMSMRSSDE